MEHFSAFDYLCNEPFFINGIGHIKCPTLRDIRLIHYQVFALYMNIISVSFESYLETSGLLADYEALNDAQKADYTMFHLLAVSSPELLCEIIRFFVCDLVAFDADNCTFLIYTEQNGDRKTLGTIHNGNFETFRLEVQRLLGIKKPEEKEPQFKNDYARKLYEMFQKNEKEQKKDADDNYSLDNMIRKFCTHNKTGINILNVWDMTYYQFLVMFHEYSSGRQYDYYDNMAANTFSFKKTSDYKPMDYMKKII